MPLACPVCRAINDRGPACRRCRADLALCFLIERQRDRALAAAKRAVASGECAAARQAIRRAAKLRHGDDVGRFDAALNLLDGRFAAAWSEHCNRNGTET